MYLSGESGNLALVPAQPQTSWVRVQVTREEAGSANNANSQTLKDNDPLYRLSHFFFPQLLLS